MKHRGRARQAGLRLIGVSFGLLMVFLVGGFLATVVGSLLMAGAGVLVLLWVLFALFVLLFFRDPEAPPHSEQDVVVSPAHGTVDVIDETSESEVMGGPCKRISIFLSVFDVHVQNAPFAGEVTYLKHCPGKFLNAMRTDCAMHNENVLVGLAWDEGPENRLAVKLIAGLIARRIVPWLAVGEKVERGERISLIQFGSRVDLYLPLSFRIRVQLGEKVAGGKSVVAVRQ